MYSLRGFGEMMLDRVRMDAYTEALRRAITPGCVVADIGAGTGILSLLACRLGARRVYALEPSSSARLITPMARDNGFEDRVIVLEQLSSQVSLPEPVDVMVSDLRGVLPPFHRHLADIADARARWLAPGGRQIPTRDTLHAAVISAEEPFEASRMAWQHKPFDLELRAALPFANNTWQKHRAAADALLCEPFTWATLDYTTINEPRVTGSGTLTITKDATAHGLLAWFDTELCEGVGFSNAPHAPEAIYGQAYFRWPQSVMLRVGDRVVFELRADPIGSQYVWTWTTAIESRDALGVVAQRFRQSEFLATPLSGELLRKRSEAFVPKLSANGDLTWFALARMRSGTALQQIAHELHERSPNRFRTASDALDFVADLSEKFSV